MPLLVTQWDSAAEKPAVLPVGHSMPMTHLIRFSRAQGLVIAVEHTNLFLRVQHSVPALTLNFFKRKAQLFAPTGVAEVQPTVGRHAPDLLGNGIDELPKP